MEFIDNKTIKSDRILNDLDKFVLSFVKILEKYTDYVIVSGYVSILFGRARATEDVDLFFKKINKGVFSRLYAELLENGFICLNSSDVHELYDYLLDNLAIRFARKNEVIPNFEIKFPKDELDEEVFKDFIVVKTKLGKIKISSFERQIAFKRYYLKTDKDIEDARHIESLFKGRIDKEKIYKYKKQIGKIK